ncbi:hypothetical protein H8356DRAFT_1634760 [Neocallimastix lanati (nom. inval.)]|jgi:sugar-specific transcriptional regulator TrmB/predicted amidophosphoribosyltransferase|nr:hypothetical protein H8356DRAFT_1634760 [Neocallimastix sp. JGI-2020a]
MDSEFQKYVENMEATHNKGIVNGICNVIDQAEHNCAIVFQKYKVIPEVEKSIENAVKRGVEFRVIGQESEEESFSSLKKFFSNIKFEFRHRQILRFVLNEKGMFQVSKMELSKDKIIDYGCYYTDKKYIETMSTRVLSTRPPPETIPLISTFSILEHYCKIIDEAKKKCTIVTPYYKSIPEIEYSIEKAVKRGVVFDVIGREDEEEEFEPLRRFPNMTIKFYERLHAKLIYNEEGLVMSSMNFTESSVNFNQEIGVYILDKFIINKIRKKFIGEDDIDGYISDPEDYNSVQLHCSCGRVIKNNNEECPRCKRWDEKIFGKKSESTFQFCKKCGRPIKYDPEKPLCYGCFLEEEEEDQRYDDIFDNEMAIDDYIQHCRRCKTPIPADPDKPYCYSCFLKVKDEDQHCDLCGRPISPDPDKPLCYDCYKREMNNEQHRGLCGRPISPDPDKPLCYNCYTKDRDGNINHNRQFCCICGCRIPPDPNKPLCMTCFLNERKREENESRSYNRGGYGRRGNSNYGYDKYRNNKYNDGYNRYNRF